MKQRQIHFEDHVDQSYSVMYQMSESLYLLCFLFLWIEKGKSWMEHFFKLLFIFNNQSTA